MLVIWSVMNFFEHVQKKHIHKNIFTHPSHPSHPRNKNIRNATTDNEFATAYSFQRRQFKHNMNNKHQIS